MSVPGQHLHVTLHDPRPHHQGHDLQVLPLPGRGVGADVLRYVDSDTLSDFDAISGETFLQLLSLQTYSASAAAVNISLKTPQ